MLPNLNLTNANSLNYGYSLDPYTYQYTNWDITINNLSLNSSVTIFNGCVLINTVRQNKLIYNAGVLDVEKIKNDILLNVMAGYMQVLMDYEAINVSEAQVQTTSTQVEQAKKFVGFGKVAELYLLQFQLQLATDKLTKISAKNQLQLNKLALLQLIKTPIKADFEIEKLALQDLFPDIPMTSEEIDKISEGFLPQIKVCS